MPPTRPDRPLQQARPANLVRPIVERLFSLRPSRRWSGHAVSLLPHLRKQEALLREAYAYFAGASDVQLALSYAAEWLLDNFYVVERAVRQIHEHMPVSYYRQLPRLDVPPLAGYPRVYGLARDVIERFENQLDLERVASFVREYQGDEPLTMGELWALPTMLRLGLVENLTRAIVNMTRLQAREERADRGGRSFVGNLEDDAVVASCIQSLRKLDLQDWKRFFEDVSLVEHILRGDPADVYPRMDFETRNRYRGVVEGLALASGQSELEVAREAVRLAEAAYASPDAGCSRAAHIGFYLLDKGRVQLEERLGYRPPWRERVGRWLLNHPALFYLGSIFFLTLVLLLGLVGYAYAYGGLSIELLGVALLLFLPTMAIAIDMVNWIVTRAMAPQLLPRMDFQDGIPEACRTVVAIPALLTDADEVRSLLHQLELHFLGNADPQLSFALLADWTDAPRKYMPSDDVLLEQAEKGVQTLNRKYGQQGVGPFYLFCREREWNDGERCWMGWERKRGKLADFNRLLRGDRSAFSVQVGNLAALSGVRYVITLDADTLMPREGARRLIATLAHPLNRAEFDPESGAVVAGYTVLQPRVEIKPASAGQSRFVQIFSGDTGLDLYTLAVSDVYQDLFGEGIYAGKGIYDVDAFERSLAGRVPVNALLSHDLFEGIHGRAGLVTDIVLYEDYPPHYLAHARRLHRWVRGDWQLLPWLFPKVPGEDGRWRRNVLSLIDRWKILDNLRRSLLAPAMLALLIAGWLWLPGSAWVWTVAGILAAAVLVFSGLVTVVREGLRGTSWRVAVRSVWTAALRWLLALVFLPYETLIMLDAILATLHRLLISRQRLLQWTTAAHTLRLFGREAKVGLIWRQMSGAPVMACALTILVILMNRESLPVAAPLLFAWMVSPYVAHWISRPIFRERSPLSDVQRRQLRGLARRTWLYFEQFVGPDDQWLPPDHFQESPLGLVAHRTSPTNIGLMLLSTLAAYDLGYIGPLDLVLRLRPAFETMDRLERHRGHFLNWYDTGSLRPLPPRYVSTVDSGNLAACLLALRQGCVELADAPVLRWQRWQGMLDTLDILAETVGAVRQEPVRRAVQALLDYLASLHQQILAARENPAVWPSLLARLGSEGWQELERLLVALVEAGPRVLEASTLHDLRTWSERVDYQMLSMQSELDMLMAWLLPMSQPPALFSQPGAGAAIIQAWRALIAGFPICPSLGEIARVCREGQARLERLRGLLADDAGPQDLVQEARAWCARLDEELYAARMAAESLLIGLRDLGEKAEACFQDMDFSFLFDTRRQVFHIGYNVEAGTLDVNCYDLLASEARVASLIAIAKGDVPQSHWLHLSRPITHVDGLRPLLSWGGTMFEYLMPTLLLRSYEGTLLDQSCRAAVDHQIAYGRQKGVPWGISESGYYRFDAGRYYQYRGFGVPGLGFRRGLGEDLVIAPYASILALPFRPQAVMQNIERLMRLQMLGRYGFYEAIDYTRSRLPPDQKSAIVRSYMVHHHAMSFLTLTNYLLGDVMVRRTHADPRVQSVQLLLQEQVPRQVPLEVPHPDEVHAVRRVQPLVDILPWRVAPDAPVPQVHALSNGSYSVLVTAAGGGYSHWQGVDLTRWRADTTLDEWGSWVYVQDVEDGSLWSVTFQPTCVPAESQEAFFYPHKAEFSRRERDLSLRMEIAIPPDDDVEVRRITLTNHGGRSRHLKLTSYGEVVLAPQSADQRHQAFNKLFVESQYLPELNGLSFRRRPCSADERPLSMVHLLVAEGDRATIVGYETDRLRFLGRGRTPRAPAALTQDGCDLSGATGATLDPVMALGCAVEVEPHATVQVAFVTLVARSSDSVLEMARRYQNWSRVARVFDLAHAQTELELHRLDLSSSDVECIQRLLSALLYPCGALRADPATLAANRKGQPGLWPFAISGDYPILLVRLKEQEEIDLVRRLLQAHAYWRSRQIKIDLVILNQRETGYDQELHGQLYRLVSRMDSDAWLNQRGGIFVLRADQMGEEERVLLESAARVILDGGAGTLGEQLGRLREPPAHLPRFVPTLASPEDVAPTPPLPRRADLLFDNGLGGFSADGREYVVYLEPGQRTPAPWINVVANPRFGFLVSEAGLGCTWAVNSGENRLTPWRNDPVSDTPGEALYLRDEETAQVWSPTPLPTPAAAPYLIRHGSGYSIFEHHSHGLKQRLRLFAAWRDPVKVYHLRLENTWDRVRRITVTFYAEWVLGTVREVMQQYIAPEYDAEHKVLLVRNPYNEEFGAQVAFAAASKELHGMTADRTEFLGRNGRLGRPAALDRIGLASACGPGIDPCAALQIHLDLRPGEAQEVFFLLGQGADRLEALRLAQTYRKPGRVEAAWEEVIKGWDDLLGAVAVRTPDAALDLLLNRWLLYQALSCRFWGRSALYQSSGAFGYRDQLQDVMALVHAAPGIMRDHLVEAARRQFEGGDVLHWWQPPSGRGVRTRCSDDLLWLPFVTAYYVETTGDEAILEERVPFLKGDPLELEEMERYGHYEASAEDATLYEHCLRALDRGTTAGPHGLPLIGSHDWNDGMNRVGVEGKGESVWLGWFLYATLTRFAPLCERRGEEKRADVYRQRAQDLRRTLEETAWDWGWYRRAYYDDGTPLGSSESDECQIDSIAQSWAVLSGAADPKRARRAMQAVLDRLVRLEDRLILLFAPPFDKTERDPGYIKGYPPGVRENGGQYTHAALWAVWAFAELGEGDLVGELFELLNPIRHSDAPEKMARYRVEPYVVAADVYSVGPHVGRGGWTWYTGSAGWMYRLGVEGLLGLRRAGRALRIDPCIPSHWPSYELTCRCGGTVYRIRVENPDGVSRGVKQVTLDGEVLPGGEIPLLDDGQQHEVHVLMVGRRYL